MDNACPSSLTSRSERMTYHLALMAVVLMASVPFLNPHHQNPIPTFFPEWWAALFGLLACFAVLLPRLRTQFSLPKAALIPLTLAVLILVQQALVPASAVDSALLAVLYLLWATLLMLAARCLIEQHNEQRLGLALAVGIAAGGLASVLLLTLQANGALRASGWISPLIGSRLFANLNQPNHLGLQLWLGVVAVIYLHAEQTIRRSLAISALGLLVIASLLTGSRAVLFYALALPLIALWQHRQGNALSALTPLSLIALGIASVGHFILPLLGDLSAIDTLGRRELANTGGESLRLGLWWMAAQMGGEHWLTGIGWGRFVSQSFAEISTFRAIAPPGLLLVPAEHAHNIGLHLFAELGLVAPIALGGLLIAWGVRVHRTAPDVRSSTRVFATALAVLIFLHAQFEYTLWYSFFLGIGALALTLADPARFRLPPLNPVLNGAILISALAVLLMLRADYSRLENTMQWPKTDAGLPPAAWSEVVGELVELRQSSRYGAYVDLALGGAMTLDRERVAGKLVICRKAIAFSPTNYVVFKCAGLLAIDGQGAAARELLGRALVAYPEKAEEFIRFGEPLRKEYAELEPLIRDARAFDAQRRAQAAPPT